MLNFLYRFSKSDLRKVNNKTIPVSNNTYTSAARLSGHFATRPSQLATGGINPADGVLGRPPKEGLDRICFYPVPDQDSRNYSVKYEIEKQRDVLIVIRFVSRWWSLTLS